jgi:alkenylglycerophosphocholine hydrolase
MFVFALIVAGALAIANWWSRWNNDRRLELVTKPLATIAAISVAIAADGPGDATAAAVAALVFCLIGDIALLPAVDRFVLGLVAFLFGHIAFIGMAGYVGLESWTLAGIVMVACAMIAALHGVQILRGAALQKLHKPVALYLLVISTMFVFGWATGNWLICVGSAAFIISDTILGWRTFVSEPKWSPVAIMVTYHVAIISLAASLAIA